jgi:hypothetical protein
MNNENNIIHGTLRRVCVHGKIQICENQFNPFNQCSKKIKKYVNRN